jgi:uncharacterized membrane protein
MLRYGAIVLAILSSLLYHVFLKLTPGGAHPFLPFFLTYATAAMVCCGLLIVMPAKSSLGDAVRELNWASFALALAIVGLDMAFLLAYRAGWRISLAALLVNVAMTVLLLPLGMVFFDEEISLVNGVGIVVALVGLVMMSVRS